MGAQYAEIGSPRAAEMNIYEKEHYGKSYSYGERKDRS